jgi:hypothetical protein
MALDLPPHNGRAIAQAVSRRLHTVAARVLAQVSLRGICGGQSGTGAGFLRILRFLQLFHTHHVSSGANTIGQLVVAVPSGLSLTPPQGSKLKLPPREVFVNVKPRCMEQAVVVEGRLHVTQAFSAPVSSCHVVRRYVFVETIRLALLFFSACASE